MQQQVAQTFTVRRLGETFFAEIVGLDLARPLDAATFAAVKEAHLEHGVVVFRDQRLTPEQHKAFSARFGPLQVHSMSQFNLAGHPEILLVSNDRHPDGRPVGIADAGRYWHSDMSYLREPALGSMLYARAIPSTGGDTLFCDMTAAYAALPDERKRQLESLRAIHYFSARWEREARAGLRPPQSQEERDRNPPVAQPMVRTHPETGRRALYIGGFTIGIEGMEDGEAVALLDELERWATQPRFVHRHQWRLHDLVFWDNRCAMHLATLYPPEERRHMHRTTVKGDAPFLAAG
jgi:taurine dioxygenase